MERQSGILFLLISSLFAPEISVVLGENQRLTIEQLHSKLANLAKLQYGSILLPHDVLDQLYTNGEVNGDEQDSNASSASLLNPSNLLPEDLYNHAQSESGGQSEEHNFQNMKVPAAMQLNSEIAIQNPDSDSDPVLDEKQPISSMSILDIEKSLMQEAGIMSLGNLEYDSEHRQFEFLPELKSILFPDAEAGSKMVTDNLRTEIQHEKSSPSAGFSSEKEENSDSIPEKVDGKLRENVEGDIKLELNPNGSDLEFVHANSNLKTINSIPNFSAQIFTLSYGGEKKPVLIIQPAGEISKTKETGRDENADNKNSSFDHEMNSTTISNSTTSMSAQEIEKTSIPNFSIRFPLQTNSQFQIPRYNFTLPTLFLPGLVFTQNENTKTNTHEVHVSVPQTNGMAGVFPPPHVDNSQVIELLPYNPQDVRDVRNPETSAQTKNEDKEENISQLQSETVRSESNAALNNAEKTEPEKREKADPEKKEETEPEKKEKTEPEKKEKTEPPKKEKTEPEKKEETNNQNIHKKTTQNSQAENIEGFQKIYKRLFGTERTSLSSPQMECNENHKESSSSHEVGIEELTDEDEAILCGSDGLCGVTCNRLGFHQGKCFDDDSCVCIFKHRPEFGVKLEFYVDKRARSWETMYPMQGFCHRSSCKINCERAGYITGFCEGSCFCGTPWIERSHRNETENGTAP